MLYLDDDEAWEDPRPTEEEERRAEREEWLAERDAFKRDGEEEDLAPAGFPPRFTLEESAGGLPWVLDHAKNRIATFITLKGAQLYINARNQGYSHWEAMWLTKEI